MYDTPLEIRNLLKVMDDHPDLTKSKTQAALVLLPCCLGGNVCNQSVESGPALEGYVLFTRWSCPLGCDAH